MSTEEEDKPLESATTKQLVLVDKSVKWTVPHEFDEGTLYREFSWDPSIRDGCWCCPICFHSEKNGARIHEHVLKHKVLGLDPIIEASVQAHTRGPNKQKLLDLLAQRRGDSPVKQSPIAEMACMTIEEKLRHGLVRMVVDGGRPISICEDPAVYQLFAIGANIRGDQYKKVLTKSQARAIAESNLESFRVSRAALVSDVDIYCDKTISQHREKVLLSAKSFGCTQVSDGRSNIVNDPLLVVGVVAGNMFYPMGAHNAGSNKKDARYLSKCASAFFSQDLDLAAETYASISDGARACLNSLDILEEEEYVVPIRCQSHAMSLFLKSVAKGPFKSLIDRAEELVTWIRSRPRIHVLLRELSTRSVCRFVEVRFATHVIGCRRLLLLKPHLWSLVENATYIEYRDSLSVADRGKCEKMEKIINDRGFWEEMKEFCVVTTPATVALRLMDMSLVRTKHVNAIWTALGNHLVVSLNACKDMDSQKKRNVLSAFEKERKSAHRPVFDAAWVLDPSNLDKVRGMATSTIDPEDLKEWTRLKENTIRVLSLMAKRQVLTSLRKSTSPLAKKAKMDIGSPASGKIDNNELHSKTEALAANLYDEFVTYYGGRKQYSNLTLLDEDDWLKTDGALKFFAVRVLHMACTISDVERLHKCYAHVHTSSRNRLKQDRVDRLTIARFIRRLENSSATGKTDFNLSAIEKFTSVTLSEDEALFQYGSMLEDAMIRTSKSIASQSHEGEQISVSYAGSSTVELADVEDAEEIEDEKIQEEPQYASDPDDGGAIGVGPALPKPVRELGQQLGMYGQYM